MCNNCVVDSNDPVTDTKVASILGILNGNTELMGHLTEDELTTILAAMIKSGQHGNVPKCINSVKSMHNRMSLVDAIMYSPYNYIKWLESDINKDIHPHIIYSLSGNEELMNYFARNASKMDILLANNMIAKRNDRMEKIFCVSVIVGFIMFVRWYCNTMNRLYDTD